jgi:hypothetical protein
MNDFFQVIDVSDWKAAGDEQLGSKRKQWLRDPRPLGGGRRWLFKYRQRPTTGDDWAEKIVGAIAEDLGIPHATVELAVRDGEYGVLSLDLTVDHEAGELVLGNDLLFERDPTYPRRKRARSTSKYSLDAVIRVLEQAFIRPAPLVMPPPGVESAVDVFVGYLMLDALVANLDRNHQNWGVLQRQESAEVRFAELSPTFDHASSLARGTLDDERTRRLETRDAGFSVDAYCARAISLFVTDPAPDRRLTTFEAFQHAGRGRPQARDAWRERLEVVGVGRLSSRVASVPDDRMSPIAKRFATRMLECNFRSPLEVR